MEFFKVLSRKFPNLEIKLTQARINKTPEQFVKRNFFASIYLSFFICLTIFFFLKTILIFLGVLLLIPILFFYLMNSLDLKILKAASAIDRELVFAGRFLVIELQSGIPLHQAFANITKNFESVGYYFQEIVENINLGTSVEDALAQALDRSPSKKLRRLIWQLLNSVKTGGNVVRSITTVIEQVVREQQIAVKEYGRKLGPISMFYMTMGIIAPSIGTILFTVLSLFSGIHLTLGLLLGIALMVGLIQSGFLYMIRGRRPPVEM